VYYIDKTIDRTWTIWTCRCLSSSIMDYYATYI